MTNIFDTILGRLYEKYDDGFLYQLKKISEEKEPYTKGTRSFELIAGEYKKYLSFDKPPELIFFSSDGYWQLNSTIIFTKEITINELPLYMHFPYKSESFDLFLRKGIIDLPWKLYDTSI